MIRGFIIPLLLVFHFTLLYGQQFRINTYTTQNGLVSNEIHAVIQDSTGFIWIASDAGLIRFDGKEFITLDHGVESKYIKDFCYRKNGKMIVSTDAGIHEVVMKNDTAYFKNILSSNIQISDSTLYFPNNLFEDSKSNLWISEPNASLVKYVGGTITRFTFDDDDTLGSSVSGFKLTEDPQGNLWAASNGGKLYGYDHAKGSFEKISVNDIKRINDITYLGNNELLLVGSAIIKVKRGDQTIESILKKEVPYEIKCVTKSIDGKLYFGTTEGLFRAKNGYNIKALEEVFSHNDPHRIEALPLTVINDIYFTKSGQGWVSSNSGLGLLQSNFFKGMGDLPMQHIYSIALASSNKAYISFGELYELTQEDQIVDVKRLLGPESGFIISVENVGDTIWAGNVDGELIMLKAGQVSKKVSFKDRGGALFYLSADDMSTLWICQAPRDKPIIGVARLMGNFQVKYYAEESGFKNRVLVVKRAPGGHVFAAGIGSDSYLYRYHEKSDTFINLSLPLPFANPRFEVHDIAIDSLGIVWLGTTDGLLKYNAERIEKIDLGKYSDVEARSVAKANDGSVWIATDTYGLIRYDEKTKEIVLFDESSGLPSKITVYRTLKIDQNQRIWTGTAEGLVATQYVHPKPKNTPKPVFIYVNANDERVTAADDNSFASDTWFEFKFASLSFPGDRIQYQTQIINKNLSEEQFPWEDIGVQTEVAVPVLEPGNYVFMVRANRQGGFRWSEPLSFDFEIRKVWYTTWWAYAAFIIISISLIWGLMRVNTYKLRKEKSILQARLNHEPSSTGLNGVIADTEWLDKMITHLTTSQHWQEKMKGLLREIHNDTNIKSLGIGTYDSGSDELLMEEVFYNEDAIGYKTINASNNKSFAFQSAVNKEEIIIDNFVEIQTPQDLGKLEFEDDKKLNSIAYLPINSVAPGYVAFKSEEKGAFSEKDMENFRWLARFISLTQSEKKS